MSTPSCAACQSRRCELADGVATGPLHERDVDGDRYAVLAPDGSTLKVVGAPDPATPPSQVQGQQPDADQPPNKEGLEPPSAAPGNVVDWTVRGEVSNELFPQALRAFARVTGVTPGAVEAKVLYAGSREDRNVMLLQAWTRGEDSHTFGDRAPGASGDQVFVLERAGDPESTLYADSVADLLATS